MIPSRVRAVSTTLLTELDARVAGGPDALLLHGSVCWDGEYAAGSDVDVVVVWPRLPDDASIEAAHRATLAAHPDLVVDGFHATPADLAGPPTAVGTRPVFFGGEFDPEGTLDISWPTWHELAERGLAVRGEVPPVHTDHDALLASTRANLDSYWRGILTRLEGLDPVEVGRDDSAVTWVVLGVARLHHLLATGAMTSKSGAGRYVLADLDARWHPVAREALRLRDDPATPSAYDDAAERGLDLVAFLRWAIDDGMAR